MWTFAALTDSAAFQILYPALWFFLGELIAARGPVPAVASGAYSSVQQVSLQSTLVLNAAPHRSSGSGKGSNSGEDAPFDEPWLLIVVGFAAVIALAWAYLRFRGVALGVAAALVFASIGVIVGTVRRRMSIGLFAGDWRFAVAAILVLATAALACGVFLLHPPAAPPAYDAIFDAYREVGFTALTALDTYTWLFAYQGVGAVALIISSGMLLLVAAGVVAKASLLAGARPSWMRRTLARVARSRGALVAALTLILLLDGVTFVRGGGYATRWRAQGAQPDAPRLLLPRVSMADGKLHVTGVATAQGFLTVTVRDRRRRTSRVRRTIVLAPGPIDFSKDLWRRDGRSSFVELSVQRRRRTRAEPTVFRCSAHRCTATGGAQRAGLVIP